MAGPSFRDRFFTPQVARAITAPTGILLGGAVAATTIVAGVPLVAALPLGVIAWVGKVLWSVPRGTRRERIAPFTLQEPWRRYVQEALKARNRFDEAVGRTRPGPLRDHLGEIAARMQTGVDECWLIAKRGQTLVEARRGIDVADIDRQLAAVAAADQSDPSLVRVAQSLEAQRATVEGLSADVDSLVTEMESLRQALEETSGSPNHGLAAGGTTE